MRTDACRILQRFALRLENRMQQDKKRKSTGKRKQEGRSLRYLFKIDNMISVKS